MAAEADGAVDMPQPVANPDAQTTVNDFLDYTEFFPSDLQRSLSLIGKLDATYRDATQRVHHLTAQYGQLPSIPAKERSDPILLRKQIGEALQRAINCREATFAEASRLYEVAERHCQRISVIKRKLQALPQPPSRDPTPAPVSPQAQRSLNRGFERTPHLRLTFDGGRHGAGSAARPRDRGRKTTIALPSRHRSRAYSMSSSDGSDDSEPRSTIDLVAARKLKQQDKTPKPLKTSRARPPGVMGTNVHSSVAGISTSNALAKLSPPPPDAKPGSKWAPWFKLTEYEMAVLRKQMKKNAVWTPSPAMVKRELERKGRGQEAYDVEKARCEATGEDFLDEEPESLAKMMAARAQQAEAAAATITASAPIAERPLTPAEPLQEGDKEDVVMTNDDTKEEEPVKVVKKVTRESQRQQAMRDAQDLEDATKKIRQAADGLKELSFGSKTVTSPTSQRRRSTAKPSNKRKRESSPYTAQSPANDDGETSFASHDGAAKPSESKRPRLPQLESSDARTSSLSPLATIPGATSVSPTSTFAVRSPVSNTPILPPESSKATTTTTTTVLVPLAPAGPGTPKTVTTVLSEPPSPSTVVSTAEAKGSSSALAPVQPQAVATAASSRPRRESAAPSKPSTPPPAPTPSVKSQKATTPGLEQVPPSNAPLSRPRSARGHVPTPKAQSEEPKPHEADKPARELRRHSIFSQSTISGPTRTSTRRKPPPKGDVSAVEEGQKTVTNVKRSQGSKNKKKKKADEEQDANEEIDPDEPRYCICDDVSFGPMISCDNNCDREWFHLPCVNITEENIPSRRAKWYCPECRQQLGINAFGNPLVPPPLPGRRGNR